MKSFITVIGFVNSYQGTWWTYKYRIQFKKSYRPYFSYTSRTLQPFYAFNTCDAQWKVRTYYLGQHPGIFTGWRVYMNVLEYYYWQPRQSVSEDEMPIPFSMHNSIYHSSQHFWIYQITNKSHMQRKRKNLTSRKRRQSHIFPTTLTFTFYSNSIL